MLRSFVSASRKKREYDERVEVDDAEETIESGDEDNELGFDGRRVSRGKSTAIVPPKVGRLLSPHMLMLERCKCNVREERKGRMERKQMCYTL